MSPQPVSGTKAAGTASVKDNAKSSELPNQTAEAKYKRDPKLANVKWSDNELRDHIKGNLDTLGEKYDKNKYGNMSRKDLEQAYSKIHSQAEKQEKKDKSAKQEPGDKYEKLSRNELEKGIEKELGHKLDKKYNKMSKNELSNELASLKDKDKKSGKSDPEDKYENMSRKELTDAIAKEKGEPLNDHYKKMSKNELANELATLKEKGGSTKASSNNPESWSKNELKDHIRQLSDSLGEKYKNNYDKQSQRELVNSYKALAAEQAQKDALAQKKHGAEQPAPQSQSSLQKGQQVAASPATNVTASTQAGSQQELLKRRDELKAELLKKDGVNVKEANRLRDEVDKLNKEIVANEKGQALNTGAGLLPSIKNPFGVAGWAATNINQIGIQGGSLLSDKFLSGKMKEGVDDKIFKWRSATDIVSASTGDPTGSADAILMAQRKYLEMKRDGDMSRLYSLGQDPETKKMRDDYHKLLQQIGNK